MTTLAVLIDFRCAVCGRVLAKLDLLAGTVQVKCPKCDAISTLVKG